MYCHESFFKTEVLFIIVVKGMACVTVYLCFRRWPVILSNMFGQFFHSCVNPAELIWSEELQSLVSVSFESL
jgi:uncharacterized membrane protein YobD (UPF0266 family)